MFRKCHWWWQNRSIFWIFYLCLQSLLTFALEFVSSPNIIFFCFFSVIRNSSFNQKAKENPLFPWWRLSSGTSNAATAEFSSCFYIPEEISKMSFLVFWNGNETVGPFLMSIIRWGKGNDSSSFFQENERGKILLKLIEKMVLKLLWKCYEVFLAASCAQIRHGERFFSMLKSSDSLMVTPVTLLTCWCSCSWSSWQRRSSGTVFFIFLLIKLASLIM